ncbi:MAG: SDR family oxidoreductase [Rhizobiaceae bacterium]
MKVGIFGAGYSGREIGGLLSNGNTGVWGTSRDKAHFDSLAERNITPVIFEGAVLSDELLQLLNQTTHLIVSIAPSRTKTPTKICDPTLNAIGNTPLLDIAPNLEWIGYLSTVGVYGNHDGAWVDENTAATPASERSQQRVCAENEWLSVGDMLNIPVGIFRLAGIYGPGRNAIINAKNKTSRRLVKSGQVFNRIHVKDIAQALSLAAHQKACGIFNITDDEPAPPQDVVSLAHQLIGTGPPPEIDFESADLTPMARSFYGENKRVSNAKSKLILGMDYQYPNYRSSLKQMWEGNDWRG